MAITASFITPLSNMALIQVSGEQRHEYLHGQLTVATTQFDCNKAKRAAHCDFKGKMFSALTVSHFQERFLLLAEKHAAQESLAQLKKYGVFSKVDISISEDLKAYGGYGADARAAFSILFKDLENTNLQVCENEFGQIISINDTSLRYLAYLTESGQNRLQDIYDAPLTEQLNHWEALEIEAGIGNIQDATMSEFVPQMLNFQAIDAIDFNKGCYMGQEVVARTKFLGKNKRASFILEGELAQAEDVTALAVGNNIEIQLGDNWRRGGVINRVSLIDNKIRLLAVMANDTEVGSMVRLKDTETRLVVQPLPYSLDT